MSEYGYLEVKLIYPQWFICFSYIFIVNAYSYFTEYRREGKPFFTKESSVLYSKSEDGSGYKIDSRKVVVPVVISLCTLVM